MYVHMYVTTYAQICRYIHTYLHIYVYIHTYLTGEHLQEPAGLGDALLDGSVEAVVPPALQSELSEGSQG